jgi:hypothetical protein
VGRVSSHPPAKAMSQYRHPSPRPVPPSPLPRLSGQNRARRSRASVPRCRRASVVMSTDVTRRAGAIRIDTDPLDPCCRHLCPDCRGRIGRGALADRSRRCRRTSVVMSTQAECGDRSDAHAKKHPTKLDPQLASPIRLLRTWACNRSASFGNRESGSQFRQDFALGRKPMLIVLALDAPARGPDFVSSLANALRRYFPAPCL